MFLYGTPFLTVMSLKLMILAVILWPRAISSCSHWRLEVDALGNTLFVTGDRRVPLPSTLTQVDKEYCRQNLAAIDDLHNISRKCLTPFVKQASGLLMFGFRKTIRMICSDISSKRQMIQRLACIRNDTHKQLLDSTMPALILQLESVRKNGDNSSLLMIQTCCLFDNYFRKLEQLMEPLCVRDSITYFTRMTEGSMKDMTDVICPGFRTSCPALQHSERVSEHAKRHASSVLVPLFDILVKYESMSPCKYCEATKLT